MLPPPLLSFFYFLLQLLPPLLQLLLHLPLALFSPMGQGIRSVTREASTSSSADRASFGSLSPLDPSLIVIGSLSTLEWGGSGAPSYSWGRGASTRFGDGGVDSPTNG